MVPRYSLLRCLYNMSNELQKKKKKTGPKDPVSSLKNAPPYQLSGCKYKQVIFTQQIVSAIFFVKKMNDFVTRCFSTMNYPIIIPTL